jgi:hypothetical protein
MRCRCRATGWLSGWFWYTTGRGCSHWPPRSFSAMMSGFGFRLTAGSSRLLILHEADRHEVH